jgi:hypothetical protein
LADLVLGIGMSHSPMVVVDDTQLWQKYGEADHFSPYLRDTAGAPLTFEELEQRNGARYAEQAAPENLQRQLETTRAAMARLKSDFAAANVDVVVVLGDDQMELHDLSNMPAISVYYGEQLRSGTRSRFRNYSAVKLDRSIYARGVGMDAQHVWPGHAPFAEHLIGSLIEQRFDVGAISEVPESEDGAGLGHAFGIVNVQLMDEEKIPMVPLFVNNYWPPNQVPPRRCWELGAALRKAIDGYPDALRVAVVASGGLSHFVTDEELDQRVLEGVRARDEQALSSIPAELLNAGNSEIRNWIALTAACADKTVAWDEYVPVYRTAAGTGVGLGFVVLA